MFSTILSLKTQIENAPWCPLGNFFRLDDNRVRVRVRVSLFITVPTNKRVLLIVFYQKNEESLEIV